MGNYGRLRVKAAHQAAVRGGAIHDHGVLVQFVVAGVCAGGGGPHAAAQARREHQVRPQAAHVHGVAPWGPAPPQGHTAVTPPSDHRHAAVGRRSHTRCFVGSRASYPILYRQ